MIDDRATLVACLWEAADVAPNRTAVAERLRAEGGVPGIVGALHASATDEALAEAQDAIDGITDETVWHTLREVLG